MNSKTEIGKDIKILESIDLKPVNVAKPGEDVLALVATLNLRGEPAEGLTTYQVVLTAAAVPRIYHQLKAQLDQIASNQTPSSSSRH